MTTLRPPVKRNRFKVLVPGCQIELVPDGSRSTGKSIEHLFQSSPSNSDSCSPIEDGRGTSPEAFDRVAESSNFQMAIKHVSDAGIIGPSW